MRAHHPLCTLSRADYPTIAEQYVHDGTPGIRYSKRVCVQAVDRHAACEAPYNRPNYVHHRYARVHIRMSPSCIIVLPSHWKRYVCTTCEAIAGAQSCALFMRLSWSGMRFSWSGMAHARVEACAPLRARSLAQCLLEPLRAEARGRPPNRQRLPRAIAEIPVVRACPVSQRVPLPRRALLELLRSSLVGVVGCELCVLHHLCVLCGHRCRGRRCNGPRGRHRQVLIAPQLLPEAAV